MTIFIRPTKSIFAAALVLIFLAPLAQARTNTAGFQNLRRLSVAQFGRHIPPFGTNNNNGTGHSFGDDPVVVVGPNRVELCGTREYSVRTYRIVEHTEQDVITALWDQTQELPGSYVNQYYYGNSFSDKIHIPGASTAFFGSPIDTRTVPNGSNSSGLYDRQFNELPLHIGVNVFRFQVTAPNPGNFIAAICRLDPKLSYIKSSNNEAWDAYGNAGTMALDLSGDTLVVGMPGEDSQHGGAFTGAFHDEELDNEMPMSGAVFVYRNTDSGWQQEAYIKAPVPQGGADFGTSVAIDGDIMAVGARDDDSIYDSNGNIVDANPDSPTGMGSVFIYVRDFVINPSTQEQIPVWRFEYLIKSSHPGSSREFGSSVAISGDTVIVGARNANVQTENSIIESAGRAYIFKRTQDANGNIEWTAEDSLSAPTPGSNDHFGNSVAIDGDLAVVSAPAEDQSVTESGAVFIFKRDYDADNQASWVLQKYLKADIVGFSDWFGTSIAIHGTTIVVGAHGESSNLTGVHETASLNRDIPASGAAYIYDQTTDSNGNIDWPLTAFLKGPHSVNSNRFGTAVSIDNDTVVVSAVGEKSGSVFSLDQSLMDPQDNSAPTSGAAFVFKKILGEWQYTQYLKAFNTGTSDQFGNLKLVAVSGGTIAIGAFNEQSDANEIIVDLEDTLLDRDEFEYSGAVYVYE